MKSVRQLLRSEWLLVFTAALVLAVVLLLPWITTFGERQDLYYFDITLSQNPEGTTKVEALDSAGEVREVVPQPLPARSSVIRYRYPLRPTGATTVMFRFGAEQGNYRIHSARLMGHRRNLLAQWSAAEIAALAPGVRLDGDTAIASATTEFRVPLPDRVRLEVTAGSLLGKLGPYAVGIAVTLTGVAGVLIRVSKSVPHAHLRFAEHPAGAIALVAAIAVAVQSYPVVFLGRSFVAPTNGSLLLYTHQPTVPGGSGIGYVDTQGSDIGAMMYQHLYYPMVQREAVANGEWPLWNRYNLLGTPLLGQGQSMLGDPLHWPVILADGAAWAWDLRILVARFLAAWGLGLVVWRWTRNGAASVLVAAAAPFIGYYLFRLNHPALLAWGYAPWIVYSWIQYTEAEEARGRRKGWLFLVLFSHALLNSGALKESTCHLLMGHAVGCGYLLTHPLPLRGRLQCLGAAALGGLVVAALSAPFLGPFVASLAQAETWSDAVAPVTVPPALTMAWFDEGLARPITTGEWVAGPALNGFFLVGFLVALPAWWWRRREPRAWVLPIAAIAGFAVATGALPEGVVRAVPGLAQLGNLANMVGTPTTAVLAVWAGWGLAAWFSRPRQKLFWAERLLPWFALGALASVFLIAGLPSTGSAFSGGYTLQFFVSVAALLAVLTFRTDGLGRSPWLVVLVLGAFSGLTWRHLQFTEARFSHYVFTPGLRSELRGKSPAVDTVTHAVMAEPSRVIGAGEVLSPGYAAALGWESPYGVDPLHHPGWMRLAAAAGLPRATRWDSEAPLATLIASAGVYDLLNIGWVVAMPGSMPTTPADWMRMHSSDLDVFQRRNAWPRAFATQRVRAAASEAELANLAGRDRLFACVVGGSIPAEWEHLQGDATWTARNIRSTAHGTRFDVRTEGPAVAVLTDPHWSGHFVATVDGREATIVAINAVAKAVLLPGAGLHHVEFVYWPLYYSAMLWAGAGGLAAIGLTLGRPRWFEFAQKPLPMKR